MFERIRDDIDEKEQVRLLGGKKPPRDSGGMGGGGPSLPGSRGPSTPQRGRY